MENNEWEDQLRELLGEYNAPDTHSPMGTDHTALNPKPEESLHSPDDQVQGWKRIEASLDAADQAFDETLRQKVKQFHPKYDPHTWPILLQRLADTKYLRTKLVVLKSVEVAIVLLLLLSVFNMERLGKLPFDSPDSTSNQIQQKQSLQTFQQNQPFQTDKEINPTEQPSSKTSTSKHKVNQDYTGTHQHQNINSNVVANLYAENKNTGKEENAFATNNTAKSSSPNSSSNAASSSFLADKNSKESINEIQLGKSSIAETKEIPAITMNGLQFTMEPNVVPDIELGDVGYITEPLASADLLIDHAASLNIPSPTYVKPLTRTYTEFAVLAQADYNALKMPEDHLYSSGREIVFPSKGIMSPGFGAGFTIAIGHPIWALETGVIYNAKDFEPGRQLIVGGAFDNGSVEFEAMKLQIISLPVQYRYRFDHKGRFKTYGIAGGGFNVIAQNDIDVQIKYHFASLAFGQNPNNDPNLAATIQESRRIREHIRDGAPFSTKSFVSVHAGLGIEFMISEHKAIFFQTVAQYQIPNIAFSNNNGKHLRSVSLQAGIRGPLGK